MILLTFVPLYTVYCYRKKYSEANQNKQSKSMAVKIGIVAACALVTFGIEFLNYILGTMYLINIAMSLVISTLIFMIVVASNSLVTELIKKVTILKTDAKKYVFYWLLFICLLVTFVLIIFSGEDLFTDIDWVDNFMACTKYQSYPDKSYRYD